jgi:hypothetical protein
VLGIAHGSVDVRLELFGIEVGTAVAEHIG